MTAYDTNNIFAKILRGELPCYKVYEDDKALAFLDIMPRSEGHALVITKEKARDLFDIKPEALAKLMAVVQKLAPKIQEAMGAEGVLIQQFNGAAACQTVFHLHVHIVPRWNGDTNFMPVIGETRVLAEALSASFKRIQSAFAEVSAGGLAP